MPLDATGISGACNLCGHNCGLLFDVEAGKIAKIRPDDRHARTTGYVCNKAYSIPKYPAGWRPRRRARHVGGVDQRPERRPGPRPVHGLPAPQADSLPDRQDRPERLAPQGHARPGVKPRLRRPPKRRPRRPRPDRVRPAAGTG
ncbi:MAG: hypothetical protein AAF430_19335 [Myxococcota bacterium]